MPTHGSLAAPPCWPDASALHRTPPRRAWAAITPAGLMTSGEPPKRTGGVAGSRPSWQCLATSVPASAARAAVRQSAGTTQRPAADSRWYCGRASCGAGAGWPGARPRIRSPGWGSLLASRQPVLAVADRADSIAPIGVQLVKYVLYLLNDTGRPGRGAGCPHRNRRGPGAGRPPRLWPPRCCPERNRGHRCHKDNGQRDIRCHHVLHNALPQFWTASPQSCLTVWTGLPGAYGAMDGDGGGVHLADERSPAPYSLWQAARSPGTGVRPRARDGAY